MIDAWTSTPISHPQSYELAVSCMKRGGVDFNHSQSFPTSITDVINTSTTRVTTLTPSHPLSLYIKLFTLYPTGILWKMSEWQHKASCSSNLEESQLSVTVLVADISCFVALPQSHSYLELVPLGQWWCTMPAQPKQTYKGECPFQEWLEKGLMSILSTSSSWGMKGCYQWPGIPLHTVPPPTSPSLSSSPCRHWL